MRRPDNPTCGGRDGKSDLHRKPYGNVLKQWKQTHEEAGGDHGRHKQELHDVGLQRASGAPAATTTDDIETPPTARVTLCLGGIGVEEAREILRQRVRDLETEAWNTLDSLGAAQTKSVTAPSGRRYRVTSYSFWDTEAWASGLHVQIKVYAERGCRKWFPWTAHMERGGPDDPVPAPDELR